MFKLFILCVDENLGECNRVASTFWTHVLDRQVLWKAVALPGLWFPMPHLFLSQ